MAADIAQFKRAGIAVRTDQSRHHMHHKYAVFDRVTVVTGSYNWTRSAAKHNWEHIVVANDPKLVKQFSDGFTEIWNDLAPRGSR